MKSLKPGLLLWISLISLSLPLQINLKKNPSNSGTLQYDFKSGKHGHMLILNTDNLFGHSSTKLKADTSSGSKFRKLRFSVKKTKLNKKRKSNRNLKKELRRRKKIEQLLKKQNKKLRNRKKKGHISRLLFGNDEKELELKQKEDLAQFKKMEKSSFKDNLDQLFKTAQKFKNMPAKIKTLASNLEEDLGYKEEAVQKALEQIDVKLDD